MGHVNVKARIRKRRWGAWEVMSPSGVPYFADTWGEALLVGNAAAQQWHEYEQQKKAREQAAATPHYKHLAFLRDWIGGGAGIGS